MVLAAQLQNLVSLGPPPGSGAPLRQAMLFTSMLRLKLSVRGAETAAVLPRLTALAAAVQAQREIAAEQPTFGLGVVARPYVSPEGRTKALAAAERFKAQYNTIADEIRVGNAALTALFMPIMQEQVMPVITMMLNPNAVEFRQTKRISERETREGRVYFHFTNSRGKNDDVLRITFRGNTGNIDRRLSLADPNTVGANPTHPQLAGRAEMDQAAVRRILTWHNLMLLVHEPVLLPDGTINTMQVTYTSPLFPSPIDFFGHWDKESLSFAEEGAKPHSRNYVLPFVVEWTDPPIDEILDFVADVLANVTFTTQALQTGGAVVRPTVR